MRSQLYIVRVVEAISADFDRAEEEFTWKILLQVTQVESDFEDGGHDLVNVVSCKGCGGEWVFQSLDNGRVEDIPCFISMQFGTVRGADSSSNHRALGAGAVWRGGELVA